MRTALLILLLLLAAPALAQSDQQLADRFDRAEAAARYEQALEAALAIVERHPESALWAINAARMHARLGQSEAAVAQVDRAAGLGFSGIATIDQHKDLDPLRDRPDFRAAADRIRANAKARMDAFQAEARAHVPPMHVPANAGPNPPLLIALHGTGGRGESMLDHLRTVCDDLGMVCVAPDALRPAGDGYAWTYRDESEWLIEHTLEQAVRDHAVDPGRIYLLGFSQGANIALVLSRTRPNLFAAIIPVCGHAEPNIAGNEGTPTPTYLLTGSRDPWKQTYTQARKDLEAMDAAVTLRIIPAMGHEMPDPRELRRALDWCLGHQRPAETLP